MRRTLGRAIDCRRSRERSEGSRALEFNVDGGQSAARSRESPADEKIRLSGCCEPARQSHGGQQLLPSPASLRFNEAGGSLLPGRGISGSQPRRRSKRRVLSACAFRRANEVQSEREDTLQRRHLSTYAKPVENSAAKPRQTHSTRSQSWRSPYFRHPSSSARLSLR